MFTLTAMKHPPPSIFQQATNPLCLLGFQIFLSLAENYSKLAKICRDLYPRMCVMKQMHANLFHFFMKQYHCYHASIRGNDFP